MRQGSRPDEASQAAASEDDATSSTSSSSVRTHFGWEPLADEADRVVESLAEASGKEASTLRPPRTRSRGFRFEAQRLSVIGGSKAC